MKNIPLISRHITPLCNSFTEALELLETHEIEDGELVYVEYKETEETRNIILALGISNHEYRILNLGASEPINGVLSYFPMIDTLIHNQKYITIDSGRSYLVYSKDRKTRTIEEIQGNKTFFNINDGNYYFSWNGVVRPLNDVQTKDSTRELIHNSLEFKKRDWNENDKTSPSYIHNKPSLSQLGDLTYTVEADEDTDNLYYELYWTPYGTEDDILAGEIIASKNNMPESGEVKRVGENDNFENDWEVGDYYLDITIEGGEHIYILMQPVKVEYNLGNGIKVDSDNRLHLRLDTNSGLSVNSYGKLRWDLATKDKNGAISVLDHEKIENFDVSDYVKIVELEDGSNCDFVAESANYIVSEKNPELRNTPGFHIRSTADTFLGIPGTGVAKINKITAGTDFNPTCFKSFNNNLFDPNNRQDYSSTYDYQIVSSDYCSVIWFYCPLPGNYIVTEYLDEFYLSDEPKDLGNATIGSMSDYIIEIIDPCWVTAYISMYSLDRFCVTYIGSESSIDERFRNNVVYNESTVELRKPENYTWIPITMDYAGTTVEDCWEDRNGALYFIQSWQRIKFSDLVDVEYNSGSGSCQTKDFIGIIRPETRFIYSDNQNITALKCYSDSIVRFSSPTDPRELEGYIYFELNEPIEFETGVSSYFNFGSYGIEEFIQDDSNLGTPNNTIITYYLNPQFYLEEWAKYNSTTYKNSEAIDDLDGASSYDLENKPVQGFAIIDYLNKVIDNVTPDTAKDLSMYNVFGVRQESMNTANCYVISEPGYYKIPLVYGNAIKNGKTNAPSFQGSTGDHLLEYFQDIKGTPITSPWIEATNYNDGERSAGGVIIEDVYRPGRPSYDFTDVILTKDRYIQFYYTGNRSYGNYRITLNNYYNTVLWSWHIWVVPNTDLLLPVPVNNYISTTNQEEGSKIYQMMPVNLGWIGDNDPYSQIIYQWGRKDPFPSYTDNILGTANDHSIYKTLPHSIRNPNLAFSSYITYGQWCRFNYENTPGELPYNLWDTSLRAPDSQQETSIKSIYDPCPYGFKVPVMSAFHGFIDSNETSITTENNRNIVGEYNDGFYFKKSLNDRTGIFFPYIKCWSEKCIQSRYATYYSSSVLADTVNDIYSSYSFQFDRSAQEFTGNPSYGGLIRPILDN